MEEIDFSEISKQRSLLPRRGILRSRQSKLQLDLYHLTKNYEQRKAELTTELDATKLALASYMYTTEELEFLSRAQSTCKEFDAPGVYAILLNAETVYVGEAQCLHKEMLEHAKCIVKGEGDFDMYAELNLQPKSALDFCVLERIKYPDTVSKHEQKSYRIDREGAHIKDALDAGCNLYNKKYHYNGRTYWINQ